VVVDAMSGKRYEVGVALSPPLGCEKVIVAAAEAIGILSADRGTRVIDRALAFFCVKKLTDFSEDMILLMAQDSTHRRSLCIPLLSLVVRNGEVFRDSQQVALGYLNAIITTTVSRTLRTVVQHP
jgi:hypothetical protein